MVLNIVNKHIIFLAYAWPISIPRRNDAYILSIIIIKEHFPKAGQCLVCFFSDKKITFLKTE